MADFSTQDIIPAQTGKRTQLGNTGAGYGKKEGDLIDYNGAPIKLSENEQRVHFTLQNSKDPLGLFLSRGYNESVNGLPHQEQYDANQYNFSRPNALGMADPLTAALRGKMQKAYSGTVDDIRNKYMRDMPLEQAKRMKTYQSLADSSLRNQMGIQADSANRAADAQAKKSAKRGAILGTAGTIAGAAYGGAPGAMIGGGIGGLLGGM